MEISNINDVKLYNLSCGKSLPDWISDRKKRKLVQNDADIRNRIELIQDFKMPTVTDCVKVSRDSQYVILTGVYKPRVRCYDLNQLSLKFERCLDSEVTQFEILSEDYSKIVFMQADRYLEFHSQAGRYHRLRIPKIGHDLIYNPINCDLYVVGVSSDVYRYNLEQAKFLPSFKTDSNVLNTCRINEYHNLLITGSREGTVEAWDPRTEKRVAKLDAAAACLDSNVNNRIPQVTSLAFKDTMNLAVGTSTGLICLYDIRSSKPYLTKDHMYGLPIKKIEFIDSLDLVATMDSKIMKIWHRSDGKSYTAIQTQTDLNDLCIIPNSGMLFLASEAPQVLTYYIPSIGTAPKWCSFLEHLVEEMEEQHKDTIYDDYKFITTKDVEQLGLQHLVGTNLLRAHMHGFFIDIRLYHKAKAASDPFAYEEYKRRKIKEKLESERENRVKIKTNLPKVNRDLAIKLLEAQKVDEKDVNEDVDKKRNKKSKASGNILSDDRFKALFENPDFQVDETTQEFKLLKPSVSKLDKRKINKQKDNNDGDKDNAIQISELFDELNEDNNDIIKRRSFEFSDDDDDDNDDQLDEKNDEKSKKGNKKITDTSDQEDDKKEKLYKLKDGNSIRDILHPKIRERKMRESKLTLEDRLKYSDNSTNNNSIINNEKIINKDNINGNRIMNYKIRDYKDEKRLIKIKEHMKERKLVARKAKRLGGKSKPFGRV